MTDQEFVTRSIRIPASVAAEIEKRASDDRRSFNNYVQILLEDHLERAEAAKPATAQAERA